MVAVSVQIEGVNLTWPRWKRLVAEVERLGFDGIYRSDHFVAPPDGSVRVDWLELVVSLAYLADHTEHVRFGSLVAPLSFRDPVMLAHQALALDDLSGGRMVLGVGTGWVEAEHKMFGYELGDMATRFARLEEGLEVITRLLRSEKPVSYEGRSYQLHDALLLPRPQRPGGPPIMIGGIGRTRTIPLVARYADIWNSTALAPEVFRETSALLDDLLHQNGRQPDDVRRTIMIPVVCGYNESDLERQVGWLRLFPNLASTPLETLLDITRTQVGGVIGTPDQVAEGLSAYVKAGVEEVMVQWFVPEYIEGLELLAEHVLPHLSA